MQLCLRINSLLFLALSIAVSSCAELWPLTFLGRSRVSLWSRSWWRRKRNQNNSARCLLAPPVTWGHHRRLMLPLQSPQPQSLTPYHTTSLLKHWCVAHPHFFFPPKKLYISLKYFLKVVFLKEHSLNFIIKLQNSKRGSFLDIVNIHNSYLSRYLYPHLLIFPRIHHFKKYNADHDLLQKRNKCIKNVDFF